MSDDPLDEFRSPHEPSHHWHLKKKFLMKHQGHMSMYSSVFHLEIFPGDFSLSDLVGLAQTFGNIEFLGCTYPPETMKQVGLLGTVGYHL